MSKDFSGIGLSVVLLVGAPIVAAQSSTPNLTSQTPIWSATAKQVGYSMSDFKNFRPTVGGDTVRIQFLDSHRVAFFWITPDTPPTKMVGPATGVPSHLHVSILDADTGQRLSYHEWACTSLGVNVAYTASGQWLVSTNQSVTLYSDSFIKIREIQNVRTQRSLTFVSLTGRTFLSYASDSTDEGAVGQLRDSATLEMLDSWNDSRLEKAYILYSDRFFLARIFRPQTKLQLAYIREVGGIWNLYSQNNLAQTRTCMGFVNDDTLVCLNSRELIAETVSGTELFKSMLPQPGLFLNTWSKAAIARNGERFAIIFDRFRGLRNETLDMYPFPSDDRVVVYSLTEKRPISSVRVKGASPWPIDFYPVWNRIALSPDGLLLGIVSGEGARVYRLS